MKSKKAWIPLFLAPAIILFVIIYAIPLVMVVFTSLFDYRLTSNSMEFVGLENFVSLFQDAAFRQSFGNTIVWIFIQCILHVGLGLILALILYKRPVGWKFVRTAYMVPNIISNAAMGMIFLNIFNPQFGVLNSILRKIGLESLTHNWLMETQTAFPSATMIWFLFAGYTTTLILAEALSVDGSILEAARIDGATDAQIDRLIMLPMLRKIIGTTAVMAATYMLQMFDLIYITTGGGPGTATSNLPLLLYQIFKSENNYGRSNAIGVVIIALGIVCMLIINRVFRVNDDED